MKEFRDVSRAATCASGVISECFSRKSVVTKRRDPVTLRAAKPYGMTSDWGGRTVNYFCTASAGFTLIELLVVVLIIGFLATVAVPQYTKAVEKSRITEAKILLKALSDAEDVYVLSNGDPCGTYNIEDLDISLPGTVIENGAGVRTKNFDIYIDECVYYDDTVGKGNARAFFADRLGQEWSVLWGGPSYGEFKNGSFYCWNAYSKEDEICPKAGAIKNAEGDWIFQ